VLITIWTLILCGGTALYYANEVSNSFNSNFNPFGGSVLRLARIGQNMFDWLLFLMIGLVLFIVPGFTAASIAGERERQTLIPMQVSLLRPIDIIVGKIASSVVFVLILVAITTPVLAFAYIIGGITIRDVIVSLAMLTFSALAIACLTVACSAFVRRVPAAIVTAYGVMLAMTIGSLALFAFVWELDSSRGFDRANPPLTILATNPVVALADVSDSSPPNDLFFYGADTPMAGMRQMLSEARGDRFGNFGAFPEDAAIAVEAFPGPNGEPIFVPPPPGFPPDEQFNQNLRGTDGVVPYWLQYVLTMTGLSGLAIWLSAWRVRTPAKVER